MALKRASPARAAAFLQIGDLLQAALAVPPQGADHAGPQRALAGGAEVDAEVVGVAGEGADHGVLPAGHAEGEEVLLRGEESGVRLVGGDDRHVPGDQVHGALLEGSGGGAVRLPLDPPVHGIGGVRVDPRDPQGAGVDPGAVAVAVAEQHGPVRDHRVEHGPGGGAAGEDVHRPAAAADPGGPGVGRGVGGDDGQVALGRVLPAQVAAEHLHPGHGRVDVGVLEARYEQAAREVDDLGGRVHEGAYAALVGDGEDPASPDGDGRPDRGIGGTGEHLPSDEYGVRPLPVPVHRRFLRLGGPGPHGVFVEEE